MKKWKVSVMLLLALLLAACSSAPSEPEVSAQPPKEEPAVTEGETVPETPETAPVIRYEVDTVMHGDTRKVEEDVTLFSYAVEVPELTAWREDGTQITEAATPEEEKALQVVETFCDRFAVWYAEETMDELEMMEHE